MRIRINEEFRHVPNALEGVTQWVQPGEYTVKADPGPGEAAVTGEIAKAAITAGAATDITGDARAPKD